MACRHYTINMSMNIIIIIQPIFSLKGAYPQSYLMNISIIRERVREKDSSFRENKVCFVIILL